MTRFTKKSESCDCNSLYNSFAILPFSCSLHLLSIQGIYPDIPCHDHETNRRTQIIENPAKCPSSATAFSTQWSPRWHGLRRCLGPANGGFISTTHSADSPGHLAAQAVLGARHDQRRYRAHRIRRAKPAAFSRFSLAVCLSPELVLAGLVADATGRNRFCHPAGDLQALIGLSAKS